MKFVVGMNLIAFAFLLHILCMCKVYAASRLETRDSHSFESILGILARSLRGAHKEL